MENFNFTVIQEEILWTSAILVTGAQTIMHLLNPLYHTLFVCLTICTCKMAIKNKSMHC